MQNDPIKLLRIKQPFAIKKRKSGIYESKIWLKIICMVLKKDNVIVKIKITKFTQEAFCKAE